MTLGACLSPRLLAHGRWESRPPKTVPAFTADPPAVPPRPPFPPSRRRVVWTTSSTTLSRPQHLDMTTSIEGLRVGLKKGPTEFAAGPAKPNHQASKGKISKHTKFVRALVREVAGMAPYERRICELLKVGKDKRALKMAKRKLGTHRRGKAKREECSNLLRAAQKK